MKRKHVIAIIVALILAFLLLSPPQYIPTLLSPIKVYIPIAFRGYEAPDPRLGASIRDPSVCPMLDSVKDRIGWWYDWGNRFCAVDGKYVHMAWLYYTWVNLPFTVPILGRNEPNLCSQGNQKPIDGSLEWYLIETRYYSHTLVSPAVSQPAPYLCETYPGGISWLWAMVNEYVSLTNHRPRFDVIAVHCYSATDYCKQYIQQVRDEAIAHGYDVPIWVTEFGTCTGPSQISWMLDMMNWFSSKTWITRWAWYSMKTPTYECGVSLFNEDGTMTPLGQAYFAWRP